MGSNAWIDLVEVAYNITLPDDQWLSAVTGCAADIIGPGRSVLGYTVDNNVRVAHTHTIGPDTWLESVRTLSKTMPTPVWNTIHPSGITTTTMNMFVERACTQGFTHPLAEDPNMRAHGYQDNWATIAINAGGRGVVLCSPLKEPTTLKPSQQQPWLRLAVHIAAAVRLRHELRQHHDLLSQADAIFNPDGSPAHLTPETSSASAQNRLRRAAERIDKARGTLRRSAPLDALELWEGLVAGRWSALEHIDTDGRRFVVFKENEPQVTDPRKLSLRERQVVHFVVQGHHNKLIAYELGLSTSTVGHHLKKAIRKLGFNSRSELITFYQQLISAPPPPTASEDSR